MDSNSPFSSHGDSPSSQRRGDTVEHINREQLQRLVHMLDTSDVSEIEVKRAEDGLRLVLRKAKAIQGSELNGQQVIMAATPAREPEQSAVVATTQRTVVASLVGIFHSWAKPKGGSLVAIGDRVKAGQLVGTIQSLNVMNEVESPIAGHVTDILVQDGQAVEYGQPLMVIDSKEGA